MKTLKSAQDFIDFYSDIPDYRWYVKDYCNSDHTKFCMFGHLGGSAERDMKRQYSKNEKNLQQLFDHLGMDPPSINDGLQLQYKQSTPKARVLAALNDIKNLGF